MICSDLIPRNDEYKLASALLKLRKEINQGSAVPEDIEIADDERCLILDRMAIVQSLVKVTWVKTCSDFAVLFIQKAKRCMEE